MFTEISGYQREELIDREITKIAPKLFSDSGVSCFAFSGEQKEKEGFINHKFNHVIAVEYSVTQTGEGEWHVMFKLASQSNVKMMFLANHQGIITDFNLPAQAAFKKLQEECEAEGRTLCLSDLGVANPHAAQLRRANGSSVAIKFGPRELECIAQI
jgi:hypothetical protein